MMTDEKDLIEKMTGVHNVKFEIDFDDKSVSFESDADPGYITVNGFHDKASLIFTIEDYIENTVLNCLRLLNENPIKN